MKPNGYICLMSEQTVFKAIADPTRREILGLLADGELTLNDIAGHFEMTRPAVSKHLDILVRSDLVLTQKRGRQRFNSLKADRLQDVALWLEPYSRFWDGALDRLKQAVEGDDK